MLGWRAPVVKFARAETRTLSCLSHPFARPAIAYARHSRQLASDITNTSSHLAWTEWFVMLKDDLSY
jgi:hypothetical protein